MSQKRNHKKSIIRYIVFRLLILFRGIVRFVCKFALLFFVAMTISFFAGDLYTILEYSMLATALGIIPFGVMIGYDRLLLWIMPENMVLYLDI